MSIVWFIGGLLAAIIGSVCALGALMPRDHVASGSLVVPRPAAEVWRMVRTVSKIPSWRPSVSRVDEIEGPAEAPTRWTEHLGKSPLRLELVRADEGRTLEMRIDDRGQPFGGAWIIELTPEGAGTRVRVTERGFVKLPPFRFIAKVFIGHRASLVSYLTDLSRATHGPSAVEN